VILPFACICAKSLVSQQDDGPVLKPKRTPTKPATPTLLLICDLACNWTLDGETKGHIDAGSSVKNKVDLGQHIIVAATEDGADQVKQLSEIKTSRQTVVSIELQPVRETRLKAEHAARDKAAIEKASEEQRSKQQEERTLAERRQSEQQGTTVKVPMNAQPPSYTLNEQGKQAEAAGSIWVDKATGLMWTKNRYPLSKNWQKASDYCQRLQLAGDRRWRLPAIDELHGIFTGPSPKEGFFLAPAKPGFAKGNMRLFEAWSGSSGTKESEFWLFDFLDGKRYSFNKRYYEDVLCVRSIQ
jgi:Protein of unknown function (DUF1566)